MIYIERSLVSLAIGTLLVVGISVMPSSAKKITVTQREGILRSKIDRGEKSGELTLKEATKLRAEEANIIETQDRMKSNNGGKLSYKDLTTLESDLNKLSDKLQKKELEKRTF